MYILLALILCAAGLFAQNTGGSFSGKVTDNSGAAVPAATVIITTTSGANVQRTVTGADGSFSVSLPPGSYRIEIEKAGFSRSAPQPFDLGTSATSVNVKLQISAANETIEVIGQSPAVQVMSADMGATLSSRTVRELPVADRNDQHLTGLLTGVTPPVRGLSTVRDPDRNRFYSVNGQDPGSNLREVDGVANLEPFRGTAVRVQPMESVQQKTIVTSNYAVERGFSAGSIENNVTRAGTNGIHGSLFEFYSGNWLRARNPFNGGGNPDPRYVSNQFGATLGGAIVPDRTFAFASYEGTYRRGATTQVSTIPVGPLGNFSNIPGLVLYQPQSGTAAGAGRTVISGNRIAANQINPVAAAIASFLPEANLSGLVNNYATNVPMQDDGQRLDARIDHRIGERTQAFLRYGYTNARVLEGSPLGSIGAATRDRLIGQNAVAGATGSLSAGLITDFRMGYNRYDQKLAWASDPTAFGGMAALSGFNGILPAINIAGLASIGTPANTPERAVANTFNWAWSWSWHRGMHNVKWGTDIRRFRTDGFLDSTFGANGTAFFGPGATLSSGGPALSQYGSLYNAWAAFLLGAPSQVGTVNYITPPSVRQSQYAFWLGDSVQLMPRVSLEVGVRYELYSPLEPRRAGGAQFFDASNNTFNYAGIGTTGMQYSNYDTNNIAPRIGIAVRPTNKTSLRAGYSIQYFQPPYMYSGFMGSTYGSVSGVQGGYTIAPLTGQFGANTFSAGTAPASLANGAAAGNLPASVFPQNTTTPYVQNFTAQVQQEFYWGTVLSAGYVGALGRHVLGITELNAAFPGTGMAGLPFASIGRTGSTLSYDNGLTSNYNSLQVNLSKHFSKGLSFLASYTLSKALGYTSSNNRLLNPFDLRSNYGPQDYDRQHVLSISHLWQIPFGMHGSHLMSTLLGGWQINGIFTWETGTPLTVMSDPVACACPGASLFANLNGSAFMNEGTTFLNAAAFSAPTAGQFGNLGRNALRGPGSKNYDMSLFKSFRVRDRFNLELRGEVYNLTNTPRFAPPVTNINSPDFGRQINTINGAFGRQADLAARILF